MNIRTIFGILLLVLIFIFVFMNLDPARVWLFGIRAEMPIALVVIVSAALGMGAAFLLSVVKKTRSKAS